MDLSKVKREDVKVIDDNLDTTLAETIRDYETRADKTLRPAHIERLLINTFAYRETLARQQFNEAYRQQHARFATGLMLDLCGDDVATPRLSAQAAMTTLRFIAPDISGATTISVPKGTRAQVGELVFATAESGVLKASQKTVDLLAVCATVGVVGNGWAAGQINNLLDKLHATISVTVSNITVPSGGVEDEEDDAYRERILLAPESFSIGGTVGAYKYFARQFSPVICDVETSNDKDVNGNDIGGTVVVSVLTKDGLPGTELLTQLEKSFQSERMRILCDKPSARAPQVINYTLNAELTLYTGANELETIAAAKAAWTAYEAQRRLKLGGDIVPLDIQTVLKVPGVYNVTLKNLSWTVLSRTQWARCTSVTITAAEVQQDG